MRVAIFVDQGYVSANGSVYAAQPFVQFLVALRRFGHVTLLGRLDPRPRTSHYALPNGVRFKALPWYTRASDLVAVARAATGSLRRFWRALDDVEAVLLFGPNPLALAFAVTAMLRRRRVVLGVRQDYPAYVRLRHPERRALHAIARLIDWGFRQVARRADVVAVGGQLARHYASGRRTLISTISLIRDEDIVGVEQALAGPRSREPTILSVSRLDHEKNPLLLADVLWRVRRLGLGARLVVYGTGPLEPALARRLDELGVAADAELRGHVGLGSGLLDAYVESTVFLHVSWTEGVPQVLLEAFAKGLPVVATDVGGVSELADGCALLVPPGDVEAAARAVLRIAGESPLRTELIEAGLRRVRTHTLETETRRLAEFLGAPDVDSWPR